MTTEGGRRRPAFRPRAPWTAILALLLIGAGAVAEEPPALRVAVISDLNGSYGTVGHGDTVHDAVARIIALRPDLVISTGDMVAGQRRTLLPREQVEAMWQAFHAAVTEPLANAAIPLAVTPGNHDASAYPRFTAERQLYADQWRERRSGLPFVDAAAFPFNYAFALSGVLFVSLDVTVTGHVAEETKAWLRDLLRQQGQAHRYRVVFSHVPVWPFADGRIREATRDRELHRLVAEAGVDLYLSGHHHVFYPGVLDGVTYISQSCLGSAARRLAGDDPGHVGKGFTLLEFAPQGIRAAALTAPDFRRPLDWRRLPAGIPAGGETLTRADLAEGVVAPLRQEPARDARAPGDTS